MAEIILKDVNKRYENGYHAVHDFNLDIADFLLVLATIFSIISGVQYYAMNKDLIFGDEKVKKE